MIILASFGNVVKIYGLSLLWGVVIALVMLVILVVVAKTIAKTENNIAGAIILAICAILFFVNGTLLSGAVAVKKQVREVKEVVKELLPDMREDPLNAITEIVGNAKSREEVLEKVELVLEYLDANDCRLSDFAKIGSIVEKQIERKIKKYSMWLVVSFIVGLALYIVACNAGGAPRRKKRTSTTPKSHQLYLDIDF